MPRDRPTRLGKYDLLARIAKGGMAEIYLARQHGVVGVSRLVVVKRILPHLAEEEHFVHMFLEEARLAALIAHPSVVRIYDVDQLEGEYFIAMEYIDGPSAGVIARRAREQRKPLPWPVAAEIVAQTCDGLHAAHELKDELGKHLGLVHRDVSPHNLVLTREGVVKLVDFGIAKAQDSTVRTSTGNIKGKFPYMSPEQCRGGDLDRRTDVFSLGIVFFELITARRLFQRQTELMTLKAITEEIIPSARTENPGFPGALDEVLIRALQRNREDRYPTAAAMGEALRAALAGTGEPSSPETIRGYLEHEYADLLERRAKLVQDIVKKSPGENVPIISGFESRSSRPSRSLPQMTGETVNGRPPRRRRLILWLCVVAVIGGLGAGLAFRFLAGDRRPPGPPLRFAVVPAFSPKLVKRELRPFARHLERKLGRRVELVVPGSYSAQRHGLVSGRLHFATLSPLQYVLARHQNPRVKAVAAHIYEGARTYQGYLVVRAESPIQKPADLRGKRACYVDTGSTSGYLFPRYYLRKQGLDPKRLFSKVHISGSHTQVMRDVIKGRCDVGAIYSGAFLSASKMGLPSAALRMLAISGQLPLDVVCVSPVLPARLVSKLERALLDFDPQRDLGRKTVSDVYPITGMVKAKPESFDGVAAAARSEGLLPKKR